MIVSRKEHDLAAAAESMPGTVAWHVADVVDADAAAVAVGATIARFDRLDILVNNASTNPYFGPLTGIDAARAQRTMMANQWAPVAFIQAAWTAWMCEHGGRVINVASIGADLPEPNIGWYNATKAATVQLTRQFAQELGPGVTVNAVSPGVIKTDLSRALWERGEERIAGRVPMGRLGRAVRRRQRRRLPRVRPGGLHHRAESRRRRRHHARCGRHVTAVGTAHREGSEEHMTDTTLSRIHRSVAMLTPTIAERAARLRARAPRAR